jgi:hypothetical protein
LNGRPVTIPVVFLRELTEEEEAKYVILKRDEKGPAHDADADD